MFNRKHYIFIIILLIIGCSKSDPVTGEKVIIDPNPERRAAKIRDEGGGIFGDINKIGKNSGGTTFEFATSNVLWRATLKSLDFLPLANVDYVGGVIVYDWYSDDKNPQEQIKVSVQFLSNELRTDAIKINTNKRMCDSSNKCQNLLVDKNFNESIKENIITLARSLKIQETKKDKK
jgi:hypothetical protein